MSNRTLYILLGVFAVLALVSAWPRIQMYIEGTQVPEGFQFSNFTAESVSRVTVMLGGEEVVLTKNGDNWQVGEFAASASTIESFFETLGKLQAGELAATKVENHARLGVTDEEGTRLALLRDDHGREDVFVFGEPTEELDGLYVRRADSDEVYGLRGSLTAYLIYGVDGWRDKTVLKVANDKLAKIEVDVDGVTTILTKSGKDWEAARLGRTVMLTASQANMLNTSFNPLMASGFLDDQQLKQYRAGRPDIIRFFTADSTLLAELSAIAREDDKVWVKLSSSDIVFELDEHRLGGLAESTSFFEDKEGGD